MKKTINILIRIAIVAACLTYAFWGLDWKQFGAALAEYSPLAIIGLILYTIVQYIPVGLRFRFLTEGQASFKTAFKAVLLCLGINNIIPAKVGELAKAYYLRQHASIPLGKGLGMVFWERFFDLNMLLLLGLIAVMKLDDPRVVYVSAILAGGLWTCIILFKIFPKLPHKAASIIPWEGVRLLVTDVITQLQEKTSAKFFLVLGLYSLVVWTVYSTVAGVAILFVGNLDFSYHQILTVFIMATIGYAVPAAPGGLGIYEATFVAAMGWYGIPQAQALALAIVLHMSLFIPPIIAALYIMAESGISMKKLREESDETI